MKQILLIIALCIFSIIPVCAQTPAKPDPITETQWKELLTALDREDWDTGFDRSSDFLGRVKEEDDRKRLAGLRYMVLYTAAGKVFSGKMSYDELEKVIVGFAGKEIAFPYRRIKGNCKGDFNYICWSKEDQNKVMITATNKKAVSIFAFEYVEFKDKFNFEKNEGKMGEITGIVNAVNPNPNRSNIVILRIYVSGAHIELK